MENRKNYQIEEDVIDLKELLLYILRKWRVLIVAGLVGVVLGAGFQLIKPEKAFEDLNIESLNLKEIEQYDRYQKYYDQMLDQEEASVYLNMDPTQVYSGQKTYYISAFESDLNRIGEAYHAILLDTQIYQEMAQISGLGCTEREIRELVSVEFSGYNQGEFDLSLGEMKGSGKVTISVKAPNEEACTGMMKYLDAQILKANEGFAARLKEFTCELIAETVNVGYDEGIRTAREDSAKALSNYTKEIETLKGKLTADDLMYYSEVYGDGAANTTKSISDLLKWGIVVGILLGGLMVVFYGVKYLFNGCIKTVDELKQKYGLPLIALVAAEQKNKKRCVIDRLLETKYEYSTKEYLLTSIDVMKKSRIQLCGDMKNTEIEKKLKLFADDPAVVVCDRFAVDEQAQREVCKTDGVVFFVQLWNTKHDELLRELETCDRLGQKVLGVVIIS